MSCCANSGTSACLCGTIAFPLIVCNPANLPAISYRIGDYVSFRYRLLQALPNETALTAWQPGPQGDLAVQMVEWWAYLADILAFYNERIANEAYLTTALLPESVNHLVQLLGYRPRPALGARAQLAGLLSNGARTPVTVPQGLQVQSKPGPGQQPQVFELDQATSLQSPDLLPAVIVPGTAPLLAADSSIWLSGKVTGIKAGDRLLLANAQAITAQTLADYAWINVGATSQQTDPLGNAVTQLSFTTVSGTLEPNAQAAKYVLLRSGQSAPLWSYPEPPMVITNTVADLASVARQLTAGSLVLFDIPANAGSIAATAATNAATALQSAAASLRGSPLDLSAAQALQNAALAAGGATTITLAAIAVPLVQAAQGGNAGATILAVNAAVAAAAQGIADAATLNAAASALGAGGSGAASAAGLVPTAVIVASYAEIVWYANGNGSTPPPSSASNPVPAVSVPHTELTFSGLSGAWWPFIAPQVTARWSWTPVGQIVPVLTTADLAFTGGSTALLPGPGALAFPAAAAPVLLEDPGYNAASAVATPAATPAGAVTLAQVSTLPAGGLASPIDVLFNLMPFSRGKSVPSETLGSGNPAVAGQDFTLAKSPVTYFADPASVSGNGFSSTVKVSVNGVQWQEVQSFYGQPKNAQVFVTYEDDQGSTHITFGDGMNGARLPTGTNNVVATYRCGAGAQAPSSETLTVVQTPTPGLKGVRNPQQPIGGADADPPAKLSSLAPASVLTFNRAVSLDDYQAIAASAGGVTQVVAEYVFDPVAQRPVVTLWVAGDDGAVAAVQQALAGIGLPGQQPKVYAAAALIATLNLTYVRDPRYDDGTVQTGLATVLLDPTAGLFRPGNIGIGEPVYQSQIVAACLGLSGAPAVPGVTAIHDVSLTVPLRRFPIVVIWTGSRLLRYGQPAAAAPCSGERYDPGAGNYFAVPADGQHLILNGAIAS